MSEIVFWRHAEAHDALEDQSDLDRKLTVKGQRNAERVAHWLDRNLPSQCKVYVSEARRAQQTARCLPRKSKTIAAINPGANASDVLEAVGWKNCEGADEPVVVVGHQPWIGECIAILLGVAPEETFSVKKGAVWWLQQRVRDERTETVIRAVITPEFL
jgi:phosphohistidine phosphatase